MGINLKQAAALGGAGLGGWVIGMCAGNKPHENVHWAIEGKYRPHSNPAVYDHDRKYARTAFVQNLAEDGIALGTAGASWLLLHKSHPLPAKLGVALGLGAFVGVEFEMKAVLSEADPNDPGHHVDFPAFPPFHTHLPNPPKPGEPTNPDTGEPSDRPAAS